MTDSAPHPIPPLAPILELPTEEVLARATVWLDGLADPENTWIFGTGSLIWNPGFPFIECRRASVDGWQRGLSLYSITYRGTPERPGLVMGLEPGPHCEGCAFRIDPARLREAAKALWDREMSHDSYEMLPITAETADGPVSCYSFAVREDHPQCAIGLPPEKIEAVVRVARGLKGSNLDYVLNTIAHLDEWGIYDEDLHALGDRLTQPTGSGA